MLLTSLDLWTGVTHFTMISEAHLCLNYEISLIMALVGAFYNCPTSAKRRCMWRRLKVGIFFFWVIAFTNILVFCCLCVTWHLRAFIVIRCPEVVVSIATWFLRSNTPGYPHRLAKFIVILIYNKHVLAWRCNVSLRINSSIQIIPFLVVPCFG